MSKSKFLLPLLILFVAACSDHATDKYFYESKNYPEFSIVELKWDGLSLTNEIRKHSAIAKTRNQKVFLQMTGEWCSPCKRLRKKTEKNALMEAYRGTYVIRIDYDEWENDLAQIGLNKAPVPSFWELGENNMVTSHYTNGNHWPEITAEVMGPILKLYFSGEIGEQTLEAQKFKVNN
ncbi:MAG: thioredoxin family protein [Kangiellaceae bacterium]|nr:thioredoxin family protein [Kangiellaceae bacterium]